MYSELIEVRDEDVDGETNWMWIKDCDGSFYGSFHHWRDCHKEKYFKHIEKFDTIVTAGTNCGMYARLYAKMFKHVYAFEPEPLAFYCMTNNAPYDNVIKLNAALGDGHGIVGINRATAGKGASRDMMNAGMNTIAPADEKFQIPMMTIDSLCLNACDMIQLDVEGFEQFAIRGALATIKKFKPVIIAERFNTHEHQVAMKQINYILVDISSADAIYVHEDRLNKSDEEFIYTT